MAHIYPRLAKRAGGRINNDWAFARIALEIEYKRRVRPNLRFGGIEFADEAAWRMNDR